MTNKNCVVLKGCAGGVNMLLDEDTPINEIMESIKDKIRGAGGFFKGECTVFVSGRELSHSDELRINSVMKTVYPEANIVYKKEPGFTEPEQVTYRNHTDKGAKFIESLMKTAEASKGVLRSDKGKLRPQKIDVRQYVGDVKPGQQLNVQGDILVIGNVHPGGTVSADGSVYVMGRLSGNAYAGISGNEKATVMAAIFDPKCVSISGIDITFDEIAQENIPKMAYLMNRTIFIDKIL